MNPYLAQLFQMHGVAPGAMSVQGDPMAGMATAAMQAVGPRMMDAAGQLGQSANPLAGVMAAPNVPTQGGADPASSGPSFMHKLSNAINVYAQSQAQQQQPQTPAPQLHAVSAIPSLWQSMGINPTLTGGLLGGH